MNAPVLFCAGLLLCGCAAPAGPADGGTVESTDGPPQPAGCPRVEQPAVHCKITVRSTLAAPAAAVFLAGEFNNWDATAQRMNGPDKDGAYEADLSLLPGAYGYKLVADGNWLLDPDNSYRKYVNGIENSGLRVADCRNPALRVAQDGAPQITRPSSGQGGFSVKLAYVPGAGGRPLCGVTGTLHQPQDHAGPGYKPRALTDAELRVAPDGKTIQVVLTGLQDGKYTVLLQALSGDGPADSLLLPFWIESTPFSFADSPLYLAVTDRFRDGDPANDQQPTPKVDPAADYKGGDLAGVTAAIKEGYFDRLNLKTLWVTPFYTQTSDPFIDSTGQHYVSSYHGYWPIKAREVDPRLGGAEALHAMVEEAHRHGMRVLMDAVLQHVHVQHEYYLDAQKSGWFHGGCVCGTPGCDWTVHRLDCVFADYLPDVDWTNTQASEQFIADTLWWIEEFDLDGLRIDAVKHLRELTIKNLTARVRERFQRAGTTYYMVGETAMGWNDSDIAGNADNYDTIKEYMGPDGLNGQLDFVLYHAIPYRVFARDGGDNRRFQHVDFWTHASLDQFSGSLMTVFVGSHDTSRFVTLATYRDQSPQWPGATAYNQWSDLPLPPPDQEPYDRQFLALLNLMTIPGVPLLYYGDEYGEYGGGDPDSRHVMRFDAQKRSAMENVQFDRMTRLLAARAALRGLQRGDLVTAYLQETLYAYARPGTTPQEGALVVLNLLATPQSAAIPVPAELPWSSGTALSDYLTGTEYSVAAGAVMVTVPGRGGVVLGIK